MGRKKGEKGNIVEEEIVEKKRITLSVRPQRIAFLVPEDIDLDSLAELIQYNTNIWGGLFNIFVPTNRDEISKDWWELLERFDPDTLCLCSDISQELQKEILNRSLCHCFRRWSKKILSETLDEYRDTQLKSVNMTNVLQQEFENLYIPEESVLIWYDIDSENPYFLPIISSLGIANPNFEDWFKETLKAHILSFKKLEFHDYLIKMSEIQSLLSPIDLTARRLRISYQNPLEFMPRSPAIFLFNTNSINDFCLFWYFRKFCHRNPPLLLPLDVIRREDNLFTLANWLESNYPNMNLVRIYSSSLNLRRAKTLLHRFQQTMPKQYQYKIHFCHFERVQSGHVEIFEKRNYEEEVFVNGKTRLRSLSPTTEIGSISRFMLDIDVQGTPIGNQGYLLWKTKPFSDAYINNRLLLPEANVKISTAHSFSVPVSEKERFIELHLKPIEELVAAFFSYHGLEWETTEKARYYKGMVKLAGGIEFFDIFKQPAVRKLFRLWSEADIGFSVRKISSLLSNSLSEKEKESNIETWAQRNIILRGYNLRCPHCDLNSWYSIEDVSENITCFGCLSKFQVPLRLSFDFRLNELFCKGIKQGAIPVLLTLAYLDTITDESFLYLPGLRILEDNNKGIDIDIFAICDRHIIVAECKDLESGCSETDLKKRILSNFKKVFVSSKPTYVEIVLLSTLLNDPSLISKVQDFVKKLEVKGKLKSSALFLEDLTTEQYAKYKSLFADLHPLPIIPRKKCDVVYTKNGVLTW